MVGYTTNIFVVSYSKFRIRTQDQLVQSLKALLLVYASEKLQPYNNAKRQAQNIPGTINNRENHKGRAHQLHILEELRLLMSFCRYLLHVRLSPCKTTGLTHGSYSKNLLFSSKIHHCPTQPRYIYTTVPVYENTF